MAQCPLTRAGDVAQQSKGKTMAITTRIPFAAALGAAMLIVAGLLASPAQAGYVMTLEQLSGDVVGNGSGTIDLTGLAFAGSGTLVSANIGPSLGYINNGLGGATLDVYTGFTGPTSFGSGGITGASSGSGDADGIVSSSSIYGLPLIWVPSGYVSNSLLSDTATYAGESFASLGMTPGIYVWTWGSGSDRDSFTINIRAAAVPEPTGLALLALPMGLFILAKRRRQS